MPKISAKTKVKKTKKVAVKNPVMEETVNESSISAPKIPFSFPKGFRLNKTAYIAIILIGLSLLAVYKKSWFIAATVNGAPISNFELLNRINSQYRSQTLDQMINEKLILDEAREKGVDVTDKEVTDKIAQIETQVGGAAALDGLLAQQGQTRSSMKDQIKLVLLRDKLYSAEATVSAEEVTQFIEQNKNALSATDSAGQTKEAEDILKQQKISKIFSDKFQAIKKAAKIQIF